MNNSSGESSIQGGSNNKLNSCEYEYLSPNELEKDPYIKEQSINTNEENENKSVDDKLSILSLKGNGIMVLLMSLAAFLVMFVDMMLVPALPYIVIEHGFVEYSTWISWTLSAYSLVGTVTVSIILRFADVYGKKTVLLVCMTIESIAVLCCGFSYNMPMLIAFRALSGIGMRIMRDTFDKSIFPFATSIVSSMFNVGTTSGLLGGGAIIAVTSWKISFFICGPLLFCLLLAFAYFIIPTATLHTNETSRTTKIDWLGCLIFAIFIFCLSLGITLGNDMNWSNTIVIVLFSVASVFFIIQCFYIVKFPFGSDKIPLLPYSIFLNLNASIVNFSAFFCATTLFIINMSVPFYLSTPYDDPFFGYNINSSLMVGLYMIPLTITQIVSAPIYGYILKKSYISSHHNLVVSLFFICSGFGMLIGIHRYFIGLLFSFIVIGLGFGGLFVSMFAMLRDHVAVMDYGAALGINSVLFNLGTGLGPIISSIFLSNYVKEYNNKLLPTEIGFQYSWTVCASIIGFDILFSLSIYIKKILLVACQNSNN